MRPARRTRRGRTRIRAPASSATQQYVLTTWSRSSAWSRNHGRALRAARGAGARRTAGPRARRRGRGRRTGRARSGTASPRRAPRPAPRWGSPGRRPARPRPAGPSPRPARGTRPSTPRTAHASGPRVAAIPWGGTTLKPAPAPPAEDGTRDPRAAGQVLGRLRQAPHHDRLAVGPGAARARWTLIHVIRIRCSAGGAAAGRPPGRRVSRADFARGAGASGGPRALGIGSAAPRRTRRSCCWAGSGSWRAARRATGATERGASAARAPPGPDRCADRAAGEPPHRSGRDLEVHDLELTGHLVRPGGRDGSGCRRAVARGRGRGLAGRPRQRCARRWTRVGSSSR